MTLRALNRLRNADVVVHDRWVGTEVLDQMPLKAQRVDVGKGGLVDRALAQQGVHTLQDDGIAFEAVPRMTAASGC